MGRKAHGREISGWVNLDKPRELGSTPAVAAVRRMFDAKKAGHAGTLDPLASGILPVALGEATKTVQFMQAAKKNYEVRLRWGAATQTDDVEGEIIDTSDHRPSAHDILAALDRLCEGRPARVQAAAAQAKLAHAWQIKGAAKRAPARADPRKHVRPQSAARKRAMPEQAPRLRRRVGGG